MGVVSFFKKVFSGEADADPELRAARARHNIVIDGEKKDDKRGGEEAREPYDPWGEIDNVRTNFFMGSWASRQFRVIGEDKLKAELEALEKARQEKGEGEKKTSDRQKPG
jgi:hypothetical protein